MNIPTVKQHVTKSELKHETCTWSLCALKIVRIFRCKTCFKTIHRSTTLNLVSILSKHLGQLSGEFQCNVCSKQFKQMENMSIHTRRHTGMKPYPCPTCTKRFMTESGLASHRDSCHTEKCVMSECKLALRSNQDGSDERGGNLTMEKTVLRKGHHAKKFLKSKTTTVNSEPHAIKLKPRLYGIRKRESCGFNRSFIDLPMSENGHEEELYEDSDEHNSDESFKSKTEFFADQDQKRNYKKQKLKQSGQPKTKKQSKRFNCDQCEKSYSSACKLKVHLRAHTGERPFECDICGKRYSRSDKLRVHKRIHSGQRPHACDLCPKKYFTLNGLSAHKLVHSGEKPFACDICDKQFSRLDKLHLHQRIHSGEKPYQCCHCSRSFSVASTLRNHERIHTGEKPFACKTCGKLFRQLSGLSVHEKTYHGEKKHLCSMCSKSFPTAQGLRAHVMTHTQEKPFTCDFCGQPFRQKVSLEQHLRTHTEDEPYACTVCGKRYMSPNGLKMHMMNHNGVRPHACDMCDKRFTRFNALKDHKRTHTGEKPFSCKLCQRAFGTQSKLSRHKLTHSNVKNFVCIMCGKSFSRSDNLKTHMKSHSGDGQHVCMICGNCYISQDQLSEHMVVHYQNVHPQPIPAQNIVETVESNTVEMMMDSAEELAGTLVQLSQGHVAPAPCIPQTLYR